MSRAQVHASPIGMPRSTALHCAGCCVSAMAATKLPGGSERRPSLIRTHRSPTNAWTTSPPRRPTGIVSVGPVSPQRGGICERTGVAAGRRRRVRFLSAAAMRWTTADRDQRDDGSRGADENERSARLFAIVYDAKANKLYGLNANADGAQDDNRSICRSRNSQHAAAGVNAITVPGAVDGWQKLATQIWKEELAGGSGGGDSNGAGRFPDLSGRQRYWTAEVDYLRTDGSAAKTYLPGRAPKLGEGFAIPIWHGRSSRFAQHAERCFTKVRLQRRSWTR